MKLIKPTSKEQSNVRHIEVSEINSNVRQSNRTETVFGPNSTLRDNNIPTERISQLQMTRAARKIAAARVSIFTNPKEKWKKNEFIIRRL